MITPFLITGNGAARAAQQYPIEDSTKTIEHRRVEYNNNYYDVYVNHNEKFITVHGKTDNWKEIDKVEQHFAQIAPREYEIAYDIDIYNNWRL